MAKKPRFFSAPKPARKNLPAGAEAEIEKFSHDMRGIARVSGKAVFIDNALPGEKVKFRYSARRSKFDEGAAQEVLQPSPQRCEPRCVHAHLCGGCSLQHLVPEAQIAAKQKVLLDQLARFGGIEVPELLPPLVAAPFGYRRRARIGIRIVGRGAKKTLVFGFRQKGSNDLTEIDECPVLHPLIAAQIPRLKQLVGESDGRAYFSQLEVVVGESAAAIVLRHLKPVTAADRERWLAFAAETGIHLYLQPRDAASAHKIWPGDGEDYLTYDLPEFDLTLRFHPLDFVQVNAVINRQMVARAVELLNPQAGERLLDLFCGLGNFTLPLARRAGAVVGVEGEGGLTQRGVDNAALNGLRNVSFHACDLTQSIESHPWAAGGFDGILLDPPRSGALEVVRRLARFDAKRIVYVSCNPATLARDAGELKSLGYSLVKAGVMDMFPHTDHVESIALFKKTR
ncbi:23S rRNA (uracil(1939)-C(5))-methyltransferase RlmD [Microbulbifer thermotolerans]|uniref:23S rRNA (uracil(1939)-C(5))-methyltransferase RlmD n=1 Tax=Microbulbifer thermotolerans TaxID=252514 RepID=A0A143HNU7_MICTH|nr:23S rRNA (uracil(1939)-C(5))-methyltransferase RlmD [Microbulbifer thermotolerans]AMX03389.1 23S rRNA (uracil(1939)-C(5))-methyltransferase [Microbulbifer thermotolerans]